MPITINGSGTITGMSAGGLPDASVLAADLANPLDLSGKTLTLPAGIGGKILKAQVTPVNPASSVNLTSTSYTDTGVEATFQPTSTSSKVVVLLNHKIHAHNTSESGVAFSFEIQRKIASGSFSQIKEFAECANIRHAATSGSTTSQWATMSLFAFEDTPSTTDVCTYKTRAKTNSSAGYIMIESNVGHVWTFLEVAA